jgi:DNA-binding response OmpR family regulator
MEYEEKTVDMVTAIPGIFVVDDMESNRELLKAILSDDFEITLVSSGEQCLSLLSTRLPSLILLDVQMPGMDGYEVCRRIKSNSEFDQVQIIMVSAFSKLEHKIKAYEAGCDDYVTKPFDTEELLAKIEVSVRVHKKLNRLQEQQQQQMMTDCIVQDALTQFIEDAVNSPEDNEVVIRLIKVSEALNLECHVISNTNNGTINRGCKLSEEDKNWIMSTNEEVERSNWHRDGCSIMRSAHITLFVRGLSCFDAIESGRSLDQLQMMLRCAEISIGSKKDDNAPQQTDEFALSESYNSLNQITQTIADCELQTREVMDDLRVEIEQMINNLALTEEQEIALLASIDKSTQSLDQVEDDFKKNQHLLQDGIEGLRNSMGISSVDLF